VIRPTEAHFEVIQCFCFIQQTLEPGEEMELPLLFRVNEDISPDIHTIDVHYEFYPLEHFKQKWEKPIRQ
jgi:cytochrome c oxidase assembly protein subunit 11